MTNARVATRVANSKAAKKTDSKVKAPPKVVGKVAKKKAAKLDSVAETKESLKVAVKQKQKSLAQSALKEKKTSSNAKKSKLTQAPKKNVIQEVSDPLETFEAFEQGSEITGSEKTTKNSKKNEETVEKSSQMGQKWASLFRKAQVKNAPAYNMRDTYEAKTGIMHKVLGWGYIVANRNDRLEVLFKDGVRFLISNYKA